MGGGGGHVIVLRLRTTVSTKIVVLCCDAMFDRCRLICDDRGHIVAILTSKSTMFSRRDFHIDDDLRFGLSVFKTTYLLSLTSGHV
jgi:hypothetical protein